MSQIATRRLNAQRGGQINFYVLLSLIVFAVCITMITLFFSTRQVTKGYVVSELESINQELLRQRETYEMEISKVRSLNYIENTDKYRSMVSSPTVVFVDGGTAIASR